MRKETTQMHYSTTTVCICGHQGSFLTHNHVEKVHNTTLDKWIEMHPQLKKYTLSICKMINCGCYTNGEQEFCQSFHSQYNKSAVKMIEKSNVFRTLKLICERHRIQSSNELDKDWRDRQLKLLIYEVMTKKFSLLELSDKKKYQQVNQYIKENNVKEVNELWYCYTNYVK